MPRTQINCPNCRQPVVADIKQLFDVAQDPRAKQEILSGMFNLVQCPHCGYQGNLATPIVYHDPDKELLLTYFPTEVQMTRNEQERVIGPLINQVMSSLPAEKRKGYLLNPQTMLTLKGMVERILEADGVTKEMLEAQEKRMALIQRLMGVSAESLPEVIRQEEALIDEEFFALFSRFAEAALMSGDENALQHLRRVQQALLEHSAIGRELQSATKALEGVQKSLQALGNELTREKLLDLVLTAPDEAHLQAYVQLVRPGMDYEFFQLLSQRIEAAAGEEKERLTSVREKLLSFIDVIDSALRQRREVARRNLDALLKAEDVQAALQANLGAVDEYFVEALTTELEEARRKGDLERSAKLQMVLEMIEQQSAPPPEVALIERLLEKADDEAALLEAIRAEDAETLGNLTEMLSAFIAQLQDSASQAGGEEGKQQRELLVRMQAVFNAALRLAMEKKLKS